MTTNILKQYISNTNKEYFKRFTWLDGRSFSDAYLICVGAGPWRFDRRKKIQELALKELNGKDLMELEFPISFFPLKWQNNIINNTISYLKTNIPNLKFNDFCFKLKKENHNYIRAQIKSVSNCKKLPKVLSLFCRDSLSIDAFPIDRHVKRKLKELKLPTDEEKIIKLCYDAGFSNINEIATYFVKSSSDMQNPDWSI